MTTIEIGENSAAAIMAVGAQGAMNILILTVLRTTHQVVQISTDLLEEWEVMGVLPLEEELQIPATTAEGLRLAEEDTAVVPQLEEARLQVDAPLGGYWSLPIHYLAVAPQAGALMHLLQALAAVDSVLDGVALLLLGAGVVLEGLPLNLGVMVVVLDVVVIWVPETTTAMPLLQLEVGR